MMHGRGKSDFAVVALKSANKAVQAAAELVERRAETKGNEFRQCTHRTPSRARVSSWSGRIRRAGRLIRQTRGKSRMRESRTYGSVRGARGNSRPYRDP